MNKIKEKYYLGEIDVETAYIEIKKELDELQQFLELLQEKIINLQEIRNLNIQKRSRTIYNFSESNLYALLSNQHKEKIKALEEKLKYATDKGSYIDAETGEIFEPVSKKIIEFLILKK